MKFSGLMRLIIHLFWTLLLCIPAGFSQNNFKIFLVGDAGDHEESGETLINLRKELLANPNSAVVFLGDNSYKDILWGLVPFGYKGFDSSRNTMEKINSQLQLLDQYQGSAFFTPGNHDWWNRLTYESGRTKLAMEEAYISKNLAKNSSIANPENVFLPKNGGFGPDYVELNNHTIRLIFIDTYRIIMTGIKKNKITQDELLFYHRLDSVIRAGYILKQKIVVVAHHPVFSLGPLNKTLKHPYLFRRIKASYIQFPSYKTMASKIDTILHRYPGIYYVSGHLHALQFLETKDHIHYIISGAGSKENSLSEKEIMQYGRHSLPEYYLIWNSGGFFEIEINPGSTNTILFYDNALLKCSLED
ncbi:MAG TPA: metallophosphoesterase [Puia sp.]|nr:metallophosphoesterase [Puia sp.]